MEFEPGIPGTEITELPTKPQGSWRVQLIEKAVCLWFLFFWWTREQGVFSGQQEVEEHLLIFRQVGKEGGSWYIFVQPIITRPVNNLQKFSAPDTSRKCMWRPREESFDPEKIWPLGPSSYTGMIPIQEDFTGMRPLQEKSSLPFIIITENQEGSSVCSRRLGNKFNKGPTLSENTDFHI